MEVRALYRNARMSDRKLRLLRGVIRGMTVSQAEAQLSFMSSKAARLVLKVLRSAIANARHNFELEASTLRIADLVIGRGGGFKRFRPVSRGVAHPYRKYSSHITVVVEASKAAGTKQLARQSAIETVSADEFARRRAEGSQLLATDGKETSSGKEDRRGQLLPTRVSRRKTSKGDVASFKRKSM